jgi:hypothetical protein
VEKEREECVTDLTSKFLGVFQYDVKKERKQLRISDTM